MTAQNVHQSPHQGQLQLLGQDGIQAANAGFQLLAHVADLFCRYPLTGALDGGVQQKSKLQSTLNTVDGVLCNAKVLAFLALDYRDISCIALNNGTVRRVGQGAGPGSAVGIDQEQDFGRGCSPLDRKSTRLNSSHVSESRMPSSA